MTTKLSYSWEELVQLHRYLLSQGFPEGEVNVMIDALCYLQKRGETEQFFSTGKSWLHFTFDKKTITVQEMTDAEFSSYLGLPSSKK